MSHTTRIILIVLAVLVVAALAWFMNPPRTTIPVGPTPQTGGGDENGTVEAGLGQTVSVAGVTITPTQVLEDSRCPTDVQCIQAGTVRLQVSVVNGGKKSEQVLTLGEPVAVDKVVVTLVSVTPAKVSTVTLHDADYHFEFSIKKLTPI